MPRFKATFKGKHNELKTKVFWYLYGKSGSSAYEIYNQIGVNYRSLLSSLSKWVEWRYIQRKRVNGKYHYSLLSKGETFFLLAQQKAPMKRYQKQIETYQDWLQSEAHHIAMGRDFHRRK